VSSQIGLGRGVLLLDVLVQLVQDFSVMLGVADVGRDLQSNPSLSGSRVVMVLARSSLMVLSAGLSLVAHRLALEKIPGTS
jgi:hypothetical protein